MDGLWGIAAVLGLVAANAFFVAVEFSTTRARPTQVDDWESAGRAGSGSARHAVDNIDNYLSACQLGITLASIGLGVVAEPALHDLLEPLVGDATIIFSIGLAGIIAFGIVTGMHVVLGELSPKSLAIARTERTLLLLAPPMRIFYLVTKPLVDFLNFLGNLVLRPFGVPPASESGHQPHSEDELRQLLEQSAREGLIAEDEAQLSERVLVFGDRRAREIMRPRGAIDALSADATVAEAARRAIDSGHTRLPVCRGGGDLDDVVGFVHLRDLLDATVRGGTGGVGELARPVARVHEATLVDELLRDMRRERSHLALVLDEHGTTIGLLTLEDVIEEIVGEIEDEFDPRGHELLARVRGAWMVSGAAPVRLVAGEVGLEIDHLREATIGGHVVNLLGRVPDAGESVEVGGREAEVVEVADASIERLRFPDPDEES